MARIPKLRRQRQRSRTDRAFVQIDGRRLYLGAWGSDQAKRAYARIVAEAAAIGSGELRPTRGGVRVSRLIVLYLQHAGTIYCDAEGNRTNEWRRQRNAARHLFALYGDEFAADIGPKMLATVRGRMLEVGCVRLDDAGQPIEDPQPNSRESANANIQRLLRMLRWGAECELIPASTYQRAKTITPLRRGDARSAEAVQPAADDQVRAVLPMVSRQIAGMIQLQQLTAARPGEIVAMSMAQIDRVDSQLWIYRPARHKSAHLGKPRAIYLGPRCVEIISGFMAGRDHAAPLFSPRDAIREAASSPRRFRAKTGRRVGDRYTVASYRRAIARACKRAGVEVFTPHQLRHAAATRLRAIYGLEAVQVLLGHSSLQASQVYAEADHGRAVEIARARA